MLSNVDLSPLLVPFAYFFVAVLLVGLFKSSWFKGHLGEFLVNALAKLWLDQRTYHLIKDVTLPTENGGTTQIDHIIVSPYGVFVVETKNMKGWIFGGQHQKLWTQKIYRHTSKFQNPLHQNYKHVKTLQSLLELDDSEIHSVVVFIGDSDFKTDMPENVTYGFGYIRFIKSKNVPVLSEWEIKRLIGAIESGRLERSLQTTREHVKSLKSKSMSDTPSCPKCGSAMALRTAKRGQNAGNEFWGCSRYPACRGIVSK
ncbi:nuclease-related domain-containing protein [Thiomicrorhabdus sediminis]|uniref:Nuclease n=1 Tax=Thiomicrorhabdus sediminis TaxID=2580412 RepID=A0A4P9K686_9GAMM|nr:NERD domain-containing protein [Thiomicrorhabdus sediminis]QCU90545.1 nuclease [Thiomicrorhabdus sediminis]